ncbi:multicomponent Na+:H+ antiporter subunit C [Arthrobacter sp. PvP102]|jgi:multicomponent Na+:H+ antiporter subunit C|uniref:Na(+)/H(+) antiporter subunit C n=1 Tax=unclassified Arthrobacter TaxID=235627 RepID=UPI0000526CB5|nr:MULTISPECIES: Na(+)/H(+) antiporter subunit C [unclassified Arthrobacter]ABK05247.1 multisubunit sodium/proton antiporter, MrpC subunit [Arthrobacter sp. FB24]MBP1233263.1 multicomponent Na+:H+ antiporter subunit C [Arthrobacter sp. PvP103]MBP1238398.1 multicomponent Na+:H+ antiporter subunit C [Arthrobacter sp. PvP102]
MSVNLTLLTVMGALYACGIYLIMERSLTRVLLGLMLLANATNLLILATGGYAGLAPMFSKDTDPRDYNDPLPQALILTSIVISFAVTAFMLGIIYRTWVLARRDEIQDDVEDIRVAETPSFDAEDDSEIPVETSEFPLTMIGSDGKGITGSDLSADSGSGRGASSDGTSGDGPQGGVATVKAGDRKIKAKDAAAEEQPGSQNVTPGPEGGVK